MFQSKQSFLCGFHSSSGGPNGQINSIKRAADGKRQRSKGIIDRKRKEQISAEYLDGLEQTIFVISINHASASIRKERWSPTSQARREASRNVLVEKNGMPDRIKSFKENDSRENRLRARPGFVKLIRNGLRNEQNLI